MDIDLLLTHNGDAGLVSDKGFEAPVAGAMFDAETGMLTLEFSDMDSMELNIPVMDADAVSSLLYAMAVQVGVIEDGRIEDSWQVPLLLINDRQSRPGKERPIQRGDSVLAFERFLKNCVTGQPIHRDDLGDETSADSVMSGMNTAVLQFAPHLARQRSLEAQPNLNMAPSAPGMGMGGGGGGGGAVRSAPPVRRRSETDDD